MNEKKIRQIVKAYRKGINIDLIAKAHKISAATITNLMSVLRKHGAIIERPRFTKRNRFAGDWKALAISLNSKK